MEREGYKQTEWAKEILAQQRGDGTWGLFHSLAMPDRRSYTTEQALRKLEALGYTIEDGCIERAVSALHGCLIGKQQLPDRREKSHD
ncbi:MAG: hypothetical protein AAGU77_10965, partial [Bacillota bacterium]